MIDLRYGFSLRSAALEERKSSPTDAFTRISQWESRENGWSAKMSHPNSGSLYVTPASAMISRAEMTHASSLSHPNTKSGQLHRETRSVSLVRMCARKVAQSGDRTPLNRFAVAYGEQQQRNLKMRPLSRWAGISLVLN